MSGPKVTLFVQILARRVQDVENVFEQLAGLLILPRLSGLALDNYAKRVGVYRHEGDTDARMRARVEAQIIVNTCRIPTIPVLLRVLHILLPDNTFSLVGPTTDSEFDIYVNEPVENAQHGVQTSLAIKALKAAGHNVQLHYRAAGPYFAWAEDEDPDAAGFDDGALSAPFP